MYILNKNYIFRIEYFGGILINRKNFFRIELNFIETVFLYTLKITNGNLDIAQKVINKYFLNPKVDIKKFIKYNVLKNTNSKNYKILIFEEITKKVESKCFSVFKGKKTQLSAPLEITIYPTLQCNLACKFCFVKNRNKNIDEIKADEWIKLIKEAYLLGVLSISILGGEPTKYEEIDELLLGIDNIGINTTITTNGIQIRDTTKKIMIESSSIVPVFSLQTLNEKNYKLMGTDYKKIVESILDFTNQGKEVRVNSVYTIQSIDEIKDVVDFCINNGIKRYSMAFYVDINRENNYIKQKSFQEFRKMNEIISHYVEKKYPNTDFEFSAEGCMIYTAYPELENEISELTEFEKYYYTCRAGRTKIEIYPNGNVYPCICFENQIIPESNILNENLKYIWHNDKFIKIFGQRSSNDEKCKECGFLNICNSGCLAIRHNLYKERYATQKDPRCILHNN